MPDELAHEQDEHRREHRVERAAEQPEQDLVGPGAQEPPTTAYPTSLLGDPRLSGRGNAPVQTALMRQVQQTYGNRALQRFLHLQLSQGSAGQNMSGDDIGKRIESRTGGGNRLEPGVQRALESNLGADMSGVRVHTDSEADHLSRSVDAVAFTSGQDIYFSQGTYDPHRPEGMHLLTHEAVHTVQQSAGPVSGTSTGGGVAISDPSDSYEQEAEHIATQVSPMNGGGASAAAASSAGLGGVAAQRSALPAYMQTAMSGGHTTAAEYGLALQSFRGEQNDSSLAQYQEHLSEPVTTPVAITQRSPLKTIRRFGRASGGSSYGKFKVEQTTSDGSSTTAYKSPITITFSPDKDACNADEIAFVQTVQLVKTGTTETKDWDETNKKRMTKDSWSVDRIPGRKFGWYGFNNDGKPSGTISPGSSPSPLKDAVLHDTPQADIPNTSWSFETCAIAKGGKDAGTIYGCVSWGFEVDKDNKLTAHKVSETAQPSKNFSQSVEGWNKQAEGPEADRNATDQEKLGPFK